MHAPADTLQPGARTLAPRALPLALTCAALQFLLSRGFTNVKNVTGGIAAYSMVDRSIPEY